MKFFGYGKKRIIWYIIFGSLAGAAVLWIHAFVIISAGLYRNWLLLLLIPVIPILAVAMALLARRENLLKQRVTRLEAARSRVNELMMGAISKRRHETEFTDPSLATCYKQLDCHKEDCPAYGQEHARCWLIAGTFCRGEVQGQFAQKLGSCRLCEVYKQATSDPVDEISENFYAMNYLLAEREERLEEAYQEARAKSEKLAGLVSLSEAALSSVQLTDLLQNLLESAAALMGADLGWVSVLDSSGKLLTPRALLGLKQTDTSRLVNNVGKGIIGRAFVGRYIAVSEDLATESRQSDPYLKSFGAKTLISLPLFSGEKPVGMLTLGTLTPHRYTSEEKDSLQVAADRIAMAVENARLSGKVGRDREQAELVEAITSDIGTGDTVTSFYNSFIMHASRVINFDQASMCLWHPETKEVEIAAVRTEAPRTWLSKGLKLPWGACAIDKVIESRRPVIREEIQGAEYPTDKLLLEEGIRSAVMFPLLSKGEVLGVMHLGSFEPSAFSQEDVELIEPITRQLGLVLDNIQVMQEAERSSLVDSLTGLYSHRYFYEALQREIAVGERYKRPVSLILLHINGMTDFNGSHGYGEGDRVLGEIAKILRASVREIDIVARYGGRDYAVLLPEVGSGGDAETNGAWSVAHRIRDQIITQVFEKENRGNGFLSLSMGVAEYPINASDSAALLEQADQALRESRQHGFNEVVVA